MNKAYLVALREYMENLKTKTFWIGIMIFPVILILSILVPYWLEKEKDVRHYAVLDNSGTLLDAVEKKAAMPDMEKVLAEGLHRYEKKKEEFEKLPVKLQELVKGVSMGIDMRVRMEHGPEPGKDATKEARDEWKANKEETRNKQIEETAQFFDQLDTPEGAATVQLMADHIPQLKDVSAEQLLQVFEDQIIAPIKEWWSGLAPEEAAKFADDLSKSRYARVDVELPDENPEAKLKEMVQKDELFAYFVIDKNPVGEADSKDSTGGKYVSKNLTDLSLKNWFSRYANAIVHTERIENSGIAKDTAEWIQRPVVFESKKISAEGEEEEVDTQDTIRQWAPAVFAYVLWISVFVIAQMLLTNTVEEKSNKLMEVLLSSVSPIQLMAGKIVGIAGTGLTMVLSWVLFFILGVKLMPVFLNEMPDFDLSIIIRDPIYLGSFVAYFVLGYLLLSAILVGIGSVCNSLKEAQNLMGPVTILMIVPILALAPISKDPNGTIAKVMSYIPPFTPFVMMNRAAGPPSTMEYVITTALLIVSVVLALWAAAKIFRIGILMTGKPPKLLEILKWVKAPVGQVHIREEE